MEFTTSQGGFRSNRSYPALNHISLAPLTPRFPIDDDEDPQDSHSAHNDSPEDPYGAHSSQSRTSYLASHSVPGTPGLLSNSRSASRSRHARSKSSTRTHISDTNLQDLATPTTPKKKSSRTQLSDPTTRPDSEWMLRAGIALASSTREEKGQSWLEKRESSTSLEAKDYDYDGGSHHRRNWSGRISRSGASTPAALSRRGSRSALASRRSSKAGLAMTGLDMTHSQSLSHSRPSRSGLASPAGESREFVPAMVDERIHDEIAMIQRDWEDDAFSLGSESESETEEIDEAEMQRLTTERGFGFGGWIDRLVEWTLFGVDEYPAAPGVHVAHDELRWEESRELSSEEAEEVDDEKVDSLSVDADDNESTISRDYDKPATIDKPGERGGWEDAHWLLRVMKHALS